MEPASLGILTAVALVTSILSAIGAVGPLLAPFFPDLGLSRQGIVGTEAACQALGHGVELAVFGAAGLAFLRFAGPLALLATAVVVGSWIGSRTPGRVSEAAFTWLYKGVLALVALRLVLGDGLNLP